jgi:tetratricopeptide (TPR) repeat protein
MLRLSIKTNLIAVVSIAAVLCSTILAAGPDRSKSAGPARSQAAPTRSAPRSAPRATPARPTPARSAPRATPSRPAPRPAPTRSAPRATPSRPAPRPAPTRSAPRATPSRPAPRPAPTRTAPRPQPVRRSVQVATAPSRTPRTVTAGKKPTAVVTPIRSRTTESTSAQKKPAVTPVRERTSGSDKGKGNTERNRVVTPIRSRTTESTSAQKKPAVTPVRERTSGSDKGKGNTERNRVVTPIRKWSTEPPEARKKPAVTPVRERITGSDKGKGNTERERAVTPNRERKSGPEQVAVATEKKEAVTPIDKRQDLASDARGPGERGLKEQARRQIRTGRDRDSDTADVSAPAKGDRANVDGARIRAGRQSVKSTNQVVINNNNNVYVEGDSHNQHRWRRPYIPRRHLTSTVYINSSPYWYDWGGFYTYRWSNYSCGRLICLPWYSNWGISYYYPSYHRKYLFVSIGGYWPTVYTHRRYYWYGCHPYNWYGTYYLDYPVTQPVYNTYNYNYYGTSAEQSSAYSYSSEGTAGTGFDDFSDVREKLRRQKEQALAEEAENETLDEPTAETEVDRLFDKGVRAFGEGNYMDAAKEFREAITLDEDDVILPFTYCQALFAEGRYAHAASVLRSAVLRLSEDELTVYYPRGLYEDEEVLNGQIAQLAEATATEPSNADLKLLLGYQLLGTGENERCVEQLNEVLTDEVNGPTAEKLITLVEKAESEKAESENDETPQQ